MDYIAFDRLCKEKGITATALALKLGLSKGNTSSWKKGGNPSAEVLMKLADELNCTVDALLGRQFSSANLSKDETELLKIFRSLSERDQGRVIEKAETLAELAAERAEQERAAAEKQKCIALSVSSVSTAEEQDDFYVDICNLPVSAGTGVYLDDNHTEPLKIKHTAIAERANYAVRVSGDSMTPEYYDGDIVLVETCPSVNVGEIGIFVVDGEGYIKQFGGDKLISLNSKYPDITLRTCESVSCRGRVLGIAEPIK